MMIKQSWCLTFTFLCFMTVSNHVTLLLLPLPNLLLLTLFLFISSFYFNFSCACGPYWFKTSQPFVSSFLVLFIPWCSRLAVAPPHCQHTHLPLQVPPLLFFLQTWRFISCSFNFLCISDQYLLFSHTASMACLHIFKEVSEISPSYSISLISLYICFSYYSSSWVIIRLLIVGWGLPTSHMHNIYIFADCCSSWF